MRSVGLRFVAGQHQQIVPIQSRDSTIALVDKIRLKAQQAQQAHQTTLVAPVVDILPEGKTTAEELLAYILSACLSI